MSNLLLTSACCNIYKNKFPVLLSTQPSHFYWLLALVQNKLNLPIVATLYKTTSVGCCDTRRPQGFTSSSCWRSCSTWSTSSATFCSPTTRWAQPQKASTLYIPPCWTYLSCVPSLQASLYWYETPDQDRLGAWRQCEQMNVYLLRRENFKQQNRLFVSNQQNE